MRGRIAAHGGFTLTEMLIVTALLAALSALAVPLLSTADPQRVELAAVELVQALRFARSEAERTRIPHGVRIDAVTDSATLFRLDTSTVPPTRDFAIYHPVHRGLFVLDYGADPQTAGVAVDSAILSFASACSEMRDLVFNERGAPVCADPFGASLTAAAIQLGDGRTSRQVSVAGVTGRVESQ